MKRKQRDRPDILLYSQEVKKCLKDRFKELNIRYSDIIKDARRHGNKSISMSNISVYFNYTKPMLGCITHENLLWLILRYGINIRLQVDYPNSEYNEEKCIENLNRYFI